MIMAKTTRARVSPLSSATAVAQASPPYKPVFQTNYLGGLEPVYSADMSAHIGKMLNTNPWDVMSRNQQIVSVSGKPVEDYIVSHGGQSYARDKEHIAQGIGGASNEGITKRVQGRYDVASEEGLDQGGTGEVMASPFTMTDSSQNFAMPVTNLYRSFFNRLATPAQYQQLTDELRSKIISSTNEKTGVTTVRKPYANIPNMDDPAIDNWFKNVPEFRKEFLNRMQNTKKWSEMVGLNPQDVLAAFKDENLIGVPPQYMGHTMIEAVPGAPIQLSNNETYSHDWLGGYRGSTANTPVAIMLNKPFSTIAQSFRAEKPDAPREDIAKWAVGALGSRKHGVSEMISPEMLRRIEDYHVGLKQDKFPPNDIGAALDYLDLPKFADGGMVDSVPEEAIKNTVRDPQAARLLDLDLAKYALMNQPQRMAGGGTMKKIAKAVTKPAALSQAEKDANLKQWMSSGKIRTDEGDPLRLYHATPKNFDQFKAGGDDPTMSGVATWLTDRADYQPAAHNIGGGQRGFKEGTNVMPVYSNASRPLLIDDPEMQQWANDVFAGGKGELPYMVSPNTAKAIKEAGYDYIHYADPHKSNEPHEYIMLDPERQIKSAIGNRGTYDPNEPSITKAHGGAVRMAQGGQVMSEAIGGQVQTPIQGDMGKMTFDQYRASIGMHEGGRHMAEGGQVNVESGIDINRQYNPFSVLEKPTYGSDVPSTTPSIDQQRYELTMKGQQEERNRRYRAQQGDALAGVDPTGTLAVADAARTLGLGTVALPVHAGRVGLHYLQHGNTKDAPTGKDYEELMSPRTAEGAELLEEVGTIGSRLSGSEMGFGMNPSLWAHAPPTVAQMRAGLKLGAERAAPVLDKIDDAVRSGYESGAIPQPGLSIKSVKSIPEGEELIAHHNLSPAKLFGADSLGGMPVPSLAISKASEPMTNFGEITLIAPSSLAEPSAKNPVFRSDAYTATKPNTTFSIDHKSESNLKNLLSNTIKNIPDGDHEFYRVVDDIKELEYNPLIRSKFLEEKGVLPNKDDFAHKYDFRRAVDEIINENKNEYESWLDNFQASLPDNGVDIKERIFKGYTNMGNRRYVDANLENFVKEMKGINNRQSFFGSPAYLRAVATPKFKNFKEVKSERSRIVSAEDFEKSKKETDEKFEDLNKKLREISGYDSRDALAEVAETRNPNVLDRIYGEGNVSSDLKKEISSFVNELKSLPTGYFEAKPQRAVGLNEFAGAIIPKDSTDKVRAILKKNGITDIHEYSTPEERLSLFKKYGKHMFTAAPVAVGAGLNEVAESQEDQNNMKRGGKVSFAKSADDMRKELLRNKHG